MQYYFPEIPHLKRDFQLRKSCGKYSIPRYLNFTVNVNNWSPLLNTQSKPNLIHRPAVLDNVQITEMRDIHELWTP